MEKQNLNLDHKIIDLIDFNINKIGVNDSLDVARKAFLNSEMQVILVLDENEIIGYISRDTIVKDHLVAKDKKLVDVMNTDIYKLSIHDKVRAVVSAYIEKREYYIAVMDQEKFIGVVTPFSMARYLKEIANSAT